MWSRRRRRSCRWPICEVAVGRVAEWLQLVALVLLTLAAWDVSRPLGLAVGGVAVLVVGLALDPNVTRKDGD